MNTHLAAEDLEIIQNVDQTILVMHNAGQWLEASGRNPSKWWQPKNLNRSFLIKYAEPEEFFVGLVHKKPAVSAILQTTERNQDWSSIDKGDHQTALYIHWLAVTRQFAGQGLPKRMCEFAESFSKKLGINLLRLDTNADEKKLCELYEALGFHLMGIEQEEDRKTAFFQKEIV